MSRIGRQPVAIPKGVTVNVEGRAIRAQGPKGELVWTCAPFVTAAVKDGRVVISCERQDKAARAVFGTTRSLVANMVRGVSEGYAKTLEIQGVGFRATAQGSKLVLALGYSHPIEYAVPAGIAIKIADNNNIVVSGADKHLVGDVCAQLRSFYPPEPYKGKGVRLKGEYVRRKVGKTVA